MTPPATAVTYNYEDLAIDVCTTSFGACVSAALVWAAGSGRAAPARRIRIATAGAR